MKKLTKVLISFTGAAAMAANFAACAVGGGCSLLGKPAVASALTYDDRNSDDFKNILNSADGFAANFASAIYEEFPTEENFTVSPISVYMALSTAAECAAGNTREEILDALGVNYSQLSAGYSLLYRNLAREYLDDTDEVVGTLDLSNSIWVDKAFTVKDNCIQSLAEKYFCYSYSADFAHDNVKANLAVKDFIKDKTRGLIDKNFDLSTYTVFALINTLYLKDAWNSIGRDMSFTDDSYDFIQGDNSVKSQKLLSGYYRSGRAYEGETYTHFLTNTVNGYKIKFIVPKEGYTVDDVFTAQTIAEVNNVKDYGGTDTENKIKYHTRCFFPEFEAGFDKDIIPVLSSTFGINSLFDPNSCDYSSLTDEGAYCARVQHVTKLTVDKTGVEGAAVTILDNIGTSAGPDEYTDVYETFIVDRAFGFILTDSYNTTLFSGIVNKI